MRKILKRTIGLVLAATMSLSMIPVTFAEAAALKQGSKGAEVRNLQQNLIGLGYLEDAADGSFGAKTKDAVQQFQADFGLAIDGNAGNATQTALRNAVVRLQAGLKTFGYAPGTADGHFGSKTEKAVKNFQSQWDLKVNGIAGVSVRNEIDSASVGLRAGSTIRKGSSGTQVKYLQQALIGLGFLTGSADGHYGSATTEAVRKYQSAYGLHVDGNAGPDTTTSLKNTIITLQCDLMRKGWYSGTIDGIYGSGTKSAVKAYQNYAGVTANGVAGPKTMEKLYGYSLGGSDSVEEKTYKTWIDSLYQTGDTSRIWYDKATKKYKTVETSGCAGVALAMALNAMKNTNRYTGKSVMDWFVDHGYYYGMGTEHRGLLEYPRALGLQATLTSKSSTVIEHLKKDRLAVVLVRDITGEGLFVGADSSGHYVLVSGYRVKDGVDQVFVNNPLSYKASRWFNMKDLMRNAIIRSDMQPFVIIYK